MSRDERESSYAGEAPLEPSLRLAAQMKSLARLHNGLAHDLKSPLNTMVLNLELLKRSFQGSLRDADDLRDRQSRWVALLEKELHRLSVSLDLVLDLLVVPGEETESLDPQRLVGELATLLGPQARQQRVELESSTAGAFEGVVVRARRGALRQALLAVAAHLLEGLEEGGELALELTSADGRAVLRMASSGEQATPPTDRDTELPLHWARAVATEHRGTATWTTRAGGETLFELTLPLERVGS